MIRDLELDPLALVYFRTWALGGGPGICDHGIRGIFYSCTELGSKICFILFYYYTGRKICIVC